MASQNLQHYTLSDVSDISNAIIKLINNELNTIHTCFLAKVISINGNLVSVTPIMQDKIGDSIKEQPIINNLLVMMLGNSEWQINIPIKVGDFGIALVCENDITTYKQEGKDGIKLSDRKFNFIDSIFIPAPLKANVAIQNEGISLQNSDKSISISLTNSSIDIKTSGDVNVECGNATIKGGAITLDGDCDIGGSGGAKILTENAKIMSPHGLCTIQDAGSTKAKAK